MGDSTTTPIAFASKGGAGTGRRLTVVRGRSRACVPPVDAGGPPLRRLGVIDLGANTFHLAVAAIGPGPALAMLADAKHMVRLVPALERRTIDEESWANACGALRCLVAHAREFDGVELVGVATSAFREAGNGPRFVDAARCEHGFPIDVLDGDEEGRLVWAGARSEVPTVRGPVAVVDVGGGSVEIAVGQGTECTYSASLPLGVLRLRHRHVPEDGVMRAEHARAIAEAVATAAADVAREVRSREPRTLLLTAGTARALGRLAQGFGPRGRPGSLGRRRLLMLASLLSGRGAEVAAQLGIEAGRHDTLGPGAVAIATLMEMMGLERAQVCQRGLREGVLLREARRRAGE